MSDLKEFFKKDNIIVKKSIIIIFAVVLVVVLVGGGFLFWYKTSNLDEALDSANNKNLTLGEDIIKKDNDIMMLNNDIEILNGLNEDYLAQIEHYKAMPTVTPTPAPTPVITPTPTPKYTKYKAGMYKVGLEMPAGVYKLFTTSSYGSSWTISKDSSGTNKSEIGNDTFKNFSLTQVEDNQYLMLEDCYAIPIEELGAFVPEDGKYPAGVYRVGIDIPASEYKIYASDKYPCCSLYKSIVQNIKTQSVLKLFDSEMYITLKEGQVLSLDGAYIDIKK